MEPDEQQPGQSAFQRITGRLSRDTMVLMAALAFVALAILLAVVFPPSNSSGPTAGGTAVARSTALAQGGTAVASRGTAVASTTRATTSAVSATPSDESGSQGSAGDGTNVPNNAYPGPETTTPSDQGFESETPEATVESRATSDPADDGFVVQPTPTFGTLPTFAPVRPTQNYPAPATPPANDDFVQPTSANSGSDFLSPTAQDDDINDLPQTPVISVPRTQATTAPRVTAQPEPTEDSSDDSATDVPPAEPTVPAAPPPPPVDSLSGAIRWTAAQSPIIITHDQQLVAGASLIIEPGVEVQLAPGVSFFVDGTLYALGQPDRPIRFVGTSNQRWEGLFGRPGSDIALEHTDIRQGGAGGTVLSSEGGNLVLHTVHVNDNGGHIQVNGSRLEMRDSEVAGNDLPYGAAVEATYSNGGSVSLINNRIGGNRMAAGAAPVRIASESVGDVVRLDIQSNLLIGQAGPNLELFTNGPLQGGLSCNALLNGTNGLSVRSQAPAISDFALSIHDNAIEDHTPPIIPIYLQYGIGRGATSALPLDMRNNWWGDAIGPYEPDRHADGRGEAVGDNIEFGPWLTARPACAPSR